jgi:DNA transformation protein
VKQSKLKNIGPKTAEWLADAGIYTLEQIEDLGAVETYRRLKAAHPDKVTLNALYGLHAALLGIHWTMVTPDMKADLQRQLEKLDS